MLDTSQRYMFRYNHDRQEYGYKNGYKPPTRARPCSFLSRSTYLCSEGVLLSVYLSVDIFQVRVASKYRDCGGLQVKVKRKDVNNQTPPCLIISVYPRVTVRLRQQPSLLAGKLEDVDRKYAYCERPQRQYSTTIPLVAGGFYPPLLRAKRQVYQQHPKNITHNPVHEFTKCTKAESLSNNSNNILKLLHLTLNNINYIIYVTMIEKIIFINKRIKEAVLTASRLFFHGGIKVNTVRAAFSFNTMNERNI